MAGRERLGSVLMLASLLNVGGPILFGAALMKSLKVGACARTVRGGRNDTRSVLYSRAANDSCRRASSGYCRENIRCFMAWALGLIAYGHTYKPVSCVHCKRVWWRLEGEEQVLCPECSRKGRMGRWLDERKKK